MRANCISCNRVRPLGRGAECFDCARDRRELEAFQVEVTDEGSFAVVKHFQGHSYPLCDFLALHDAQLAVRSLNSAEANQNQECIEGLRAEGF